MTLFGPFLIASSNFSRLLIGLRLAFDLLNYYHSANMSKTILTDGDEGVRLIIKDSKEKAAESAERSPVHVVYGGADRFSIDATTTRRA